VCKKIDALNQRLNDIENYIISKSDKCTNNDLEKCKDLLDKNLFLTTKIIGEDPELGLKYPHSNMKTRLLDKVIKKYNLAELENGVGKRRYIYKKEDENKVKSKIQYIKHKSDNKFTTSDIDDIANYLQRKHIDKNYSITRYREIFLDEFGIKSHIKVSKILKTLTRNGILQDLNYGRFRVKPIGGVI